MLTAAPPRSTLRRSVAERLARRSHVDDAYAPAPVPPEADLYLDWKTRTVTLPMANRSSCARHTCASRTALRPPRLTGSRSRCATPNRSSAWVCWRRCRRRRWAIARDQAAGLPRPTQCRLGLDRQSPGARPFRLEGESTQSQAADRRRCHRGHGCGVELYPAQNCPPVQPSASRHAGRPDRTIGTTEGYSSSAARSRRAGTPCRVRSCVRAGRAPVRAGTVRGVPRTGASDGGESRSCGSWRTRPSAPTPTCCCMTWARTSPISGPTSTPGRDWRTPPLWGSACRRPSTAHRAAARRPRAQRGRGYPVARRRGGSLAGRCSGRCRSGSRGAAVFRGVDLGEPRGNTRGGGIYRNPTDLRRCCHNGAVGETFSRNAASAGVRWIPAARLTSNQPTGVSQHPSSAHPSKARPFNRAHGSPAQRAQAHDHRSPRQARRRQGALQVLTTLLPLGALWYVAVLPTASLPLADRRGRGADEPVPAARVRADARMRSRQPVSDRPAQQAFGFLFGVLSGMPQYVWSQHHDFTIRPTATGKSTAGR